MLWNELATELGFALLCAYPTSAVGLPEHAEALGHVCRLHAAAEGADGRPRLEAATRLQVSEHAPRAARQFVSELLRGWRIDEAALEDAQTVISELATNAVVHAGTEFVVSASASSSGVRLSVTDTSSALPIVRPCRPEAERGRGLHVISLLARDWGVDAGPDGKTVWAELRA
jgi:anti-sigma regulatory factor (Ser/Thr protein kinase)